MRGHKKKGLPIHMRYHLLVPTGMAVEDLTLVKGKDVPQWLDTGFPFSFRLRIPGIIDLTGLTGQLLTASQDPRKL